MILVSNIITGIATLIESICSFYMILLIINVICSWIQADPYNPIVSFVRSVTEPALYRIRKFLPFTFKTGIDFSPLILILFLRLFNSIVVQTIYEYGLTLK